MGGIVKGILQALLPYLIGAAVLAAIVGGIWLYGSKQYDAGFAEADGKCQAATLQAKLDAMTKDRDAARSAAIDDKARADRVQEEARAEMEGVAEYVEELKKRPADACLLTDDDIRSLRGLRLRAKARAGTGKP